MKKKYNGNGSAFKQQGVSQPVDFKKQKVKFPVTFNLKAVMVGNRLDEDNKKDIVGVLTKLAITHSYINKKESSKGAYISFTYKVTLISNEQMYAMYEQLRSIENLKFAL